MTDQPRSTRRERISRRWSGVRGFAHLPPVRWLVLALVFGIGAMMGGWTRDSRIQLGTVGEWVAGLATAAGLFFAARQIQLTRRQREEEEARRLEAEAERRRAMAMSVGVQCRLEPSGPVVWKAYYTVYNGGDYPVDEVTLLIGDPSASEYDPRNGVGVAHRIRMGTLLPGQRLSDWTEVFALSDPLFQPTDVPLDSVGYLWFMDPWEQHWARGVGVLELRATSRTAVGAAVMPTTGSSDSR